MGRRARSPDLRRPGLLQGWLRTGVLDDGRAAVADGVDFAHHGAAFGLGLLQRQRERGEPGQHLFALRAVAGAFGQVGAGEPGDASSLDVGGRQACRSEEHTSELQSLMRISYAVFCLKKKNKTYIKIYYYIK